MPKIKIELEVTELQKRTLEAAAKATNNTLADTIKYCAFDAARETLKAFGRWPLRRQK